MNKPQQASGDPANPTSGRPYRSHKIPACDFCRRRKSRCTRDLIDQPCLLCRMHGAECSMSVDANQRTSQERPAPSLKRQRVRKSPERPWSASPRALPTTRHLSSESSTRNAARTPQQSQSAPQFAHTDALNQSGHIVGPATARDAQVLEQYMSPVYNSAVSYARPNPYSVYSHDPRNPVVYMKVPQQRGIPPSGNGTSGFRQFEAMEKIIEPLGSAIFSIYFDEIHPPFPILDEKTVLEAYHQDGLPHTLVCEIYAVSLLLWNTSTRIRATGRPFPDVRYMWNLAVSAMNDDFLAPNFSTVLACILDLLGRPITSITYNAINVGRVVALSQSLGLNRNPLSWNLDHRQKSLRIRTWWGVLIHDQWASLSHGTPPHIQRSQWDVPLPDLDTLLISPSTSGGPVSDTRVKGAQSFIALCHLTVILSDILPLIYTLQVSQTNASSKALRRHETALDEWEESLPLWLRPGSAEFERQAAGALNLQLSYLIIKMCICRIASQELHQSDESEDREARQYYQSRCRKAARAVIDFVTLLQRNEMDVFWLPYSAYHFTSAATLILRCALEAENGETAQECVANAKTLIDFLRHSKDNGNWDLADICLAQCEAVVDKLCDGDYLDSWRRNPHVSQKQNPVGGSASNVAACRLSMGSDTHNPNEQPTLQPVQGPSLEVAVGGYTNHGFQGEEFHNASIFGHGQGLLPESPYFPDLWQFPRVDDYRYRTF